MGLILIQVQFVADYYMPELCLGRPDLYVTVIAWTPFLCSGAQAVLHQVGTILGSIGNVLSHRYTGTVFYGSGSSLFLPEKIIVIYNCSGKQHIKEKRDV